MRKSRSTVRKRRLSLREAMDLPPTINLPVVAELMGVNLNLMRDMVNSGEFPVKPMHIGERRVFPTAAVLRLLGLDVTAA